jgi:hypothetical protein
MKFSLLIRRYGLAFYWFIFALFTLSAARGRPLMLHPEEWRYPWGAVVVVWAFLALLVGALHVILRPASYRNSWGRLLVAVAYSAVLIALGIASLGTDLPGYAYVPALFAVVTMSLMVVLVLVEASVALRRRRHAA